MPLLLLLAVVIVVGIVTAYSLLLFNFAATVVAFFKVCFCGCCHLIYAAATADPFVLVLLMPLLLPLAVVILIAIVASCRLIVVSVK